MKKNNIELKFNNFTDVVTSIVYLAFSITMIIGMVRLGVKFVIWSWTGSW